MSKSDTILDISERMTYVDKMPNCIREMASAEKFVGLGGLKKAIYVLQLLDRGQTRSQIVELLNGNEVLVDTWISFLMQYNWIQQNESDEWSVTAKGRDWLAEITMTVFDN